MPEPFDPSHLARIASGVERIASAVERSVQITEERERLVASYFEMSTPTLMRMIESFNLHLDEEQRQRERNERTRPLIDKLHALIAARRELAVAQFSRQLTEEETARLESLGREIDQAEEDIARADAE